jgi:hypothetical protein
METMRARPITRRGWDDTELEVPISASATAMFIGGARMGRGSVCFDDFRLRAEPPSQPEARHR